ncbi:hypothetical protein IC582_029239 [Cucumis melo]
MSENERSDVAVFENMEEKNRGNETEVRIETSNDEAEQGHTRKLDEYDPSLNIPIALKKGTRSCTKHPICNYVSYDNLSPQFRAFTASLDSTIIPKNIYTAPECPEWKNVVMEEMKALEKNRTWEICALPKGQKLLDANGCSLLNTKQMVRLIDTRQVAKLNTVRVLLSVVVNKDWPLYQLDVKNAFFNGDLVEEVYMTLHQDLKPNLVSRWPDLRKVSLCLRENIIDLLTGTSMLGCRPADTPIEFKCKLGNSDDQVSVDKEQYQRLVGKLIYLSHTRPDISFAVSVVSQFMQAPYEKHMEAINRILRYLKNTPGKGLMFRKTNRKTNEAYTGSDWTGSVIDKKSTSGYCTFVWGNLVTWRSKKQSVVARSSAKAEYKAMS